MTFTTFDSGYPSFYTFWSVITYADWTDYSHYTDGGFVTSISSCFAGFGLGFCE
ncbi:unnamed protein product, partial [Prorocentrum cordatum]